MEDIKKVLLILPKVLDWAESHKLLGITLIFILVIGFGGIGSATYLNENKIREISLEQDSINLRIDTLQKRVSHINTVMEERFNAVDGKLDLIVKLMPKEKRD